MSQLTVDLPATLHDQLKGLAQTQGLTLNQYIGSSASNSTHFAEIVTTKPERLDDDGNKFIIFRLSVDDVVIKEKVFTTNRRGNADRLIKTRTKLNRIKSLNGAA